VLRILLLAGIILGLCTVFCASTPPLRVVVFAPLDTDAGTLMTAEVSKIPGIEVIGHRQIKLLLGAQVLVTTTHERLALGRLLAADLFLLVEPKRIAFAWIDTQTGEELFRIREDSAEALARSAVALVEEGRDVAAGNILRELLLSGGNRAKQEPAPAFRQPLNIGTPQSPN